MDVKELKLRLAPHVSTLLREFYPEGKIEGGNFKIGSVQGEKGRSMSVFLGGDQVGQWVDFATGETGDMLDLICSKESLSIVEAMNWVKKRFGLTEKVQKKIKNIAGKKYNTPILPSQDTEMIHDYLKGRAFKNTDDVLRNSGIYETKLDALDRAVVFPYYSVDNQLTFIKIKPITGEASPFTQKALKPILFGWKTIDDRARDLMIVEGEFDQVMANELGFNALSVPMGAQNLNWIEHEMPNLERFDRILICSDMDEAGDDMWRKVSKRLGDKCYRIEIPCKDINDLVKKHGYEKSKIIIDQAIESAIYKDPPTLRNISEFKEEIDQYFAFDEKDKNGFGFGWTKLDEEDITLRTHELVTVSGANGHGKSMWLSQVCLNAIHQGQKVLVGSFEMIPSQTAGRMMKQAAGVFNPTPEYRDALLDWLLPNFWLYVDTLTPKPKDLLECFEYAYRRYGINVFVVDSLTNIVRQDDYGAQQEFIESLVQFKLNFPVTVFLVTHVRKGETENSRTGKYDVKGSGSITDLADSCISVWKNKKKLEHIQYQSMLGEEPDPDVLNQWDIYIGVMKNRAGQFEGSVGFEFKPDCFQYVQSRGEPVRKYIEFDINHAR